MLTRGVLERDIQPAEVVEQFVAPWQLPSVHETAQRELATGWQRLQHLRHGEVLGRVFREGIYQSSTGIEDLHRLVVELDAETQTTGGQNVLCGQDADGHLSVLSQIDLVLQLRSVALLRRRHHDILDAHAALSSSEIRQEDPCGILTHVVVSR